MSERTNSESYESTLDQFVLYWGEMASAWGINKTMAQIHALLFAVHTPMDTDQIMERLNISRGNANMNLRNLISWGLVQKVHFKGDRKDYYSAEKDVWQTASRIIRERQRLEIQPIRENLSTFLKTLDSQDPLEDNEKEFKARVEEFIDLLTLFEEFTNVILPYISRNNLSMLNKFVSVMKKRNLLSKNPEELFPIQPNSLEENDHDDKPK